MRVSKIQVCAVLLEPLLRCSPRRSVAVLSFRDDILAYLARTWPNKRRGKGDGGEQQTPSDDDDDGALRRGEQTSSTRIPCLVLHGIDYADERSGLRRCFPQPSAVLFLSYGPQLRPSQVRPTCPTTSERSRWLTRHEGHPWPPPNLGSNDSDSRWARNTRQNGEERPRHSLPPDCAIRDTGIQRAENSSSASGPFLN